MILLLLFLISSSPLASEQGAFSFYHVIFVLELLKVICRGGSVALFMS